MSLYSEHDYDIIKIKITFSIIINYKKKNYVKTFKFTCKNIIIMIDPNPL